MRSSPVLLVLLSITALCVGCQRAPDAEQQMDNYLGRVARVLKQEFIPFDANQLSQYRLAERRDRLHDIPAERISLLDLLIDVHQCKPLQQRIAERNSVLGKVMPWSSRLGYEGELLRALDSCRQSLADDPQQQELLTELSDIAERKRSQLPAVFWNAINASSEAEHYLRFATEPLPVTSAPLTDEALPALQQLTAIGSALPEHLPPPVGELDPLFQALQRSQRSSQLITALAQTRHGLQQATAMLRAQPATYLCPMNQPSERSKILLNVFVLFYAGEIQPYLAQLQRLGEPWAAQIKQLRAVAHIPPATAQALDRLAGNPEALWDSYRQAVDEHTRAWQDVLGACQSAPGQAGWQTP